MQLHSCPVCSDKTYEKQRHASVETRSLTSQLPGKPLLLDYQLLVIFLIFGYKTRLGRESGAMTHATVQLILKTEKGLIYLLLSFIV